MICFEITLNGVCIHTAGVPNGIVTFDAVLNRADTRRPDGATEVAKWKLSGLTDDEGCQEHVIWANSTALSEGDVIALRVVRSEQADPPLIREPADLDE